ncbi:hypothetical protein, partial [Micromonospora sp. NPDC003776]
SATTSTPPYAPTDPAGQHGWSWPTPPGPVPGGTYPGQPPLPGGAYPGSPPLPGGAYPGPPPLPGGAYPGQPPLPGQPYGWYPGIDPNDPLVTPPHAGIGGWFARCSGALRRGWRQLLPIMLLTQTVPAAVIAILSVGLAPASQPVTGAAGNPALPEGYLRDVLVFYGAVLLAALVFGPLQAAGWAAGTWLVTRQATGEPVTVGAAFRYGWRRAIGLWGWTILASLLLMVGFCACFLPGVYVLFAVALFGPVYLFERQDPIGRSFGMLHKRFGMVLGRVALVVAALVVVAVVNGVLEAVSKLVFGADPMSAPGTATGAVLVAVLSAVLATPAYLFQLVGLVVAYAEQRAQYEPVNVARLAAELG